MSRLLSGTRSRAYVVEFRQAFWGILAGFIATFVVQTAAARPAVAVVAGLIIAIIVGTFGMRRRRMEQSALGRVLSETSSSKSAFELVDLVASSLENDAAPDEVLRLVDSASDYRRHPHTALLAPIRDELRQASEPSVSGHRDDHVLGAIDAAGLSLAWRHPTRELVVANVAEFVNNLSADCLILLYGYSSTICDGLVAAADRQVPPVIVVEDLQYGGASLGEHAETIEHLQAAGYAPPIVSFDTYPALLDPAAGSLETIDGDTIDVPPREDLVALLGCDAFDDGGDALIPAIAGGLMSESARFVELLKPSSVEESRRLNPLQRRLVIVAESFKAVHDVENVNPRTYSPTPIPWWIRPLHSVGMAVPFRGKPVRLYRVDGDADVYITDVGVHSRKRGGFDLQSVRDAWVARVRSRSHGSQPPAPIGKSIESESRGSADGDLIRFDAVILDYNGVIIDDESVHFQAFAEVCLDHGQHRLSWAEYVACCKGLTDLEGFRYLIRSGYCTGAVDELIEEKTRVYEANTGSMGDLLVPGARELLARLRENGIPTALITASDLESVETGLRSSGLSWAFDSELIRCGVSHTDRMATMSELLHTMGTPARATVLADDSEANLELATALGLISVGVATSPSPSFDSSRIVVPDLKGIVDLLDWADENPRR